MTGTLSPSHNTGVGIEKVEADDTEQKTNLRTCGREHVPNQAPPRNLMKTKHSQSVPTIPSRFEVTLYKGNREYKGFNSRSMRFEALRQSENPGPGQYGQQKSSFQESDDKPSWGIRGTGGFASRSRRFGIRAMPQAPPPGLGCPGPGAYDPLSALRYATEPKDFNQANASAVFNPSKNLGKSSSESKLVPGPGHYQPKMLPDAREACAAQAAFHSKSIRLKGGQDAPDDKPGPGEYYDGTNKPVGYVPEYMHGLDMRNANFKEPSRPHITKIHQDLPPANERARDLLGDFRDEVSKECLGTVGLAAAMPGPGHYKQDRDAMWKGNPVGVSGHGSFQPGSKRTDWAPEELGTLPGPGKYELPKTILSCITDAKSSFVSASERNKYQASQAPGPAWYSPMLAKNRKSFRLRSSEFVT